MEYMESLLEEYYQLSMELNAAGGPSANQGAYEDLLAIEEEICFEASLPLSENNRNLFRFIAKNQTMISYVTTALENLTRANSKYKFTTKEAMLAVFKAA